MNTRTPGSPALGRGYGLPPLNRMAIALFSLAGFFIAGYLLLFKLGAIGTLACTGGGCHTVQMSPWAVFLGVPVPAWGVGGYVVLLAVALVGLRPGLDEDRWIALALLGLSTAAFGFSVYLTALEAFVIEAWCRWCLVSAGLATLIFGFALAEVPRLERG